MVITMLLGFAHFGRLVEIGNLGGKRTYTSAILISYMLFAAYHLFSARRKGANFFRLAQTFQRNPGLHFFECFGFHAGYHFGFDEAGCYGIGSDVS